MPATQRRKLLKAAVGVATVSYVIACGQAIDGGNLTGGNLAAPPDSYGDGGSGGRSGSGGGGTGGVAGRNTGGTGNYTSGNLVAPPPPPPPPPPVDAGAEDAAVPPGNDAGDLAADAAASPPDAVDSGP